MEALRDSLPLTLVGMSIVFAVLAAISGVVALMRRLDERWQAAERAEEAAATQMPATTDRTTLVLISAAITALLGARAQVRSVRRLLPVDSPRSPWAIQGRIGLQGSHAVPRKRGR